MYNDLMFYIVGLGNPGEKYEHTRHNVGWQALDSCLAEWSFPGLVESSAFSGRISDGMVSSEEVKVLFPGTFMNNSGGAVAKLVAKSEVGNLIVVHDDIDLPLGQIKVVKGRGAGGNNGVKSIVEKLGTKDFVRIRIGIAPKSFWTGQTKRPAGGGPLERFVLKSFSGSEVKQLPEVFRQVKMAVELLVSGGVEVAMNKCN